MFLTTLCFLQLKESERTIENEQQTMDTLNTKRETPIIKSSVVDIQWANSFQQTLNVA